MFFCCTRLCFEANEKTKSENNTEPPLLGCTTENLFTLCFYHFFPQNAFSPRFEHSITNEGAGFSTGRGEFTAPVSGTYSFSWSAVSPPGRAARISLAKNDREIDVHSWAEENGYQVRK